MHLSTRPTLFINEYSGLIRWWKSYSQHLTTEFLSNLVLDKEFQPLRLKSKAKLGMKNYLLIINDEQKLCTQSQTRHLILFLNYVNSKF